MAIEKIVVGKKKLEFLKENLLEEGRYNCEDLSIKGTAIDFLNEAFGLISKELSTFNYEDDYNYLLKIFPYFIEALGKVENIDLSFEEKMDFIMEQTRNLLKTKPGKIPKSNPNYQFLKKFINNLEILQLALEYNLKEFLKQDMYDLIDYLIFERRDPVYLEQLFTMFPYLVNIENSGGATLFEQVVVEYTESMFKYVRNGSTDNLEKLVYYDSLLNGLVKASKFKALPAGEILNIKESILNEMYEEYPFFTLEQQKLLDFWWRELDKYLSGSRVKLNKNELGKKYDVPILLAKSLRRETAKFASIPLSKRKTVRGEYIITIDGTGALELDDALSIRMTVDGNYLLGVHIADPLAIIPFDSKIIGRARKISTSIYGKNYHIPMLPEDLAKGRLSLKEDKVRPVRSYYLEINARGYVENFWFEKNFIIVNKNLSYNEANRILKHGCSNDELNMTLSLLSSLTSKVDRHMIMDPLYYMARRSSSNISDTNITGISQAEKIIESSMALPNVAMADYAFKNNLPYCYRVHSVDREITEVLKNYKEKMVSEGKSQYDYISGLEKIYPKAYYSPYNYGHQGLGIKAYSHITSPLRRMADIINTHCVDTWGFSNDWNDRTLLLLDNEVKNLCTELNKRSFVTEVFSREYNKRKEL